MAINKTQALEDYKTGTSIKGEKWLSNYKSTTGKLDAAKSDDAEKLFAAKMTEAITKKSRQKGLAKLSEADLNAGADNAGSSAYTTGTAAKSGKWAKNTSPYLDEIDRLMPSMPKKTTDPMANLTNRAGHIVKGLSELKKRQV